MGIKFKHNRSQIHIDGTDAVELWKQLHPEGGPAKALKIEYANGKETDFKPVITMTVVDNK